MSLTEAKIIDALRNVIDPDLKRDIVTLGMVKNVEIVGNDVSIVVELTTPACPLREELEQRCREAVLEVPGVSIVNLEMTAKVRARKSGANQPEPIPGVKNVIAIASGKGGVGKSTVSANIACVLAQLGAKVGLLDADIYGPSIPIIMGVEDEKPGVFERGNQDPLIVPIEKYGVKIMSMGFLQPSGAAVIWRGPMVAKAVNQFLREVKWDDIDYLIVDLPPGTGDAQLTLAQAIPLSGAVVVMTPQDLAAAIAVKAIAMFRRLNVPILGVIENMSYFLCPNCNSRHHIFSHGGGAQAAEGLQAPFLGEIPLVSDIGTQAGDGTPTVVIDPEGPFSRIFREIAEKIAAQISIRTEESTALEM